jgi:hypothetical protein
VELTKKKAKDKLIPWEYCECGCKSYTCTIADHYFKLFWNLKDGWYLTLPGGYETKKYKSQKEADKAVLDFLEKKKDELIKTKKDINKVLKALKGRK